MSISSSIDSNVPNYYESFMDFRFKVETQVKIRFSDTDAMGHCNNARMISYMEEGRVEYFKKLFPHVTRANQFDLFPFILAEIQCSYKAPAFCNQLLIVSLGTTHIGTKSFTFEYDIYEAESKQMVATGKSIQVMYDYKNNKTITIPQEIKEKINNIELNSNLD
ncbi:hypothetical protein BVY03_00895 [bacterium K02(2017)]|nr:hypothetical protein BVY03_00895 [bacterium K02(2017)]